MKYKLDIPEYAQQWVVDELLKRNGEVKDEGWNHYLHKLGWIKEIEEPKQPELMEFGEACQKMENGQTFKFGSGKGGEEVTKVHDRERDMELFASNQHDEYVLFDSELLARKGKIIPAESKVLNASELKEKYFKGCIDTTGGQFDELIKRAIAEGEKKQWLNHKELREAVGLLLKKMETNTDPLEWHFYIKVVNALENLKPLE